MRMRVSNTLRQTIVRTRFVASFSAPVFYEQSTAILHRSVAQRKPAQKAMKVHKIHVQKSET